MDEWGLDLIAVVVADVVKSVNPEGIVYIRLRNLHVKQNEHEKLARAKNIAESKGVGLVFTFYYANCQHASRIYLDTSDLFAACF